MDRNGILWKITEVSKYSWKSWILSKDFSIIKDRFAFVDTADEGIFIPKPHFNSALDGDTVLVKITSGLNGR